MNPRHGTREWPVWAVWLVLVAASVLGVYLVEGHAPAHVAATAAILLAAVKIHLVFDQYMELGWHHRPLRHLLAAWLAVVTGLLLATYWFA